MRVTMAVLVFGVGLGCAASDPETQGDLEGAVVADVPAAVDVALDVGVELAPVVDVVVAPPDLGPDVPDVPDAGPPPPQPGPFQVGVARALLPVPLGIGTAGFGQVGGGDAPKSRFTGKYPATRGIYTHPSIRVVAVSQGDRDVILMRVDLVGITQQARTALVERLLKKTGRDLDQSLVIAATHTHSGPGRLVQNDIWAALLDTFFPEFFERMIEAMAEAVVAALADRAPARFGHAVLTTDALHGDRRCQNPDLMDGRFPVLRFDDAKGVPRAIVGMYAVHGTVVGASAHLLTRDIHGGIEQKLEERFANPVTAILFNSWSGDMSPKSGHVDDEYGVPHDMNGIEAAGNIAADLVEKALSSITTTDTMLVRSALTRIALDRTALGYTGETFPFDYGAVYCGAGLKEACFGAPGKPDPTVISSACIPFTEDSPAPGSTIVGAFQLGSLTVVTLPGEPVTQLGQDVLSGVVKATGADAASVMLLGYAQDYIGYDLPEDDWYWGGYEASGSLWGPKQGPYLTEKAIAFGAAFIQGTHGALGWPMVPPMKAPVYTLTDFPVEASAVPAAIATQPAATVKDGEVVTVAFHGGDPWLLAPVVTVEKAGTPAEPLLRKNGSVVGTDGYEVALSLAVEPTYETTLGPVARTFTWTATFPTRRGAATTTPALTGGTFQLRITGKRTATESYTLVTEPFTVVPK